ncbi:hypothetical protein V492_07291 [Pseudogymnoascus sp. VKM F-4246]|nr:hypothetical protein V492_07291 [Pseudogymnoascus sp. VKM F-4246]
MDAHSNEKVKEREIIEQVDISPYISDQDPIHGYNDGYYSDTSDEESLSDQGSETDEEENSTLDEDEYEMFKNRMKLKRGRSIGLSFKPNGYLIPNRQLAYLLRARKLVLYGPFDANELNTPLGESNFCPSLQDVPWRSSGLKFRANGRATATLKDPHMKKVLSTELASKHESSHGKDISTLREHLSQLGVSFDSNDAIIKNPTLEALLDAGKVVLDNSAHGYTLPSISKSRDGGHFESSFAKPSTVFFVSMPTSDIILGFDQQQKTSRTLQRRLSKPNGAEESQGDGSILDVGFIPVNNNVLEVLGGTRYIISLSDLAFVMADEKKLLSSRRPENCGLGLSINNVLSIPRKNDSCKILNCKGEHSSVSSKIGYSEFVPEDTSDPKIDFESDPNVLSFVPSEEARNLIQKFKTTISEGFPGHQKNAQPKFRPNRNPFGFQSTISLPPWNSIKFTYTTVERIPAKLRRIENVLVKVNKRVITIIDIFNESSNILGGSKKMYLPLVFRCWLRASIVAEISVYLERSDANSNPDGIIWTLLLPFYLSGETPNRAEMSVIAGQVPQTGDQRQNWDSPTAKLKTILHSGILGAFPLELFFRGNFWQWLVYEGAPHVRRIRPGPEEYELSE